MTVLLQAEFSLESFNYLEVANQISNLMEQRSKVPHWCSVHFVVKAKNPPSFLELSQKLGEMTDMVVEGEGQVLDFSVKVEKSAHESVSLLVSKVD